MPGKSGSLALKLYMRLDILIQNNNTQNTSVSNEFDGEGVVLIISVCTQDSP